MIFLFLGADKKHHYKTIDKICFTANTVYLVLHVFYLVLLIVSEEKEGDSVLNKLEALRRRIEEEPFGFEGDNMRVAVTIGAMKYSNGISLEKWVNQADEKMYSGKNSGKNKVVY